MDESISHARKRPAPVVLAPDLGVEWLFDVGADLAVWPWAERPDVTQLRRTRTPMVKARSGHIPVYAFSVTTGGQRIDHGHYQHYYEELRLLVEEGLTATNATPVDLLDQTWVITRHGVVLGVCTTTTAAALTAGIPDLAFTPISLCSSAIEDLRARWSTDPPPAPRARER